MALSKKYTKKSSCLVKFSLPREVAPGAREVRILGEFNNWDWKKGTSMSISKDKFVGEIELPTGRSYEFRYCIDNSAWENDWAADGYVPTHIEGVANSVVDVAQNKRTRPTKPATKTKAAKTKTTKSRATKPTRSRRKVDLTIIEGVGPKIKSLLAKAGYPGFEEVAKADPAALKAVLNAAGPRYQMHNPGTWPKQALLASQEKWDELKAYQATLKGGK